MIFFLRKFKNILFYFGLYSAIFLTLFPLFHIFFFLLKQGLPGLLKTSFFFSDAVGVGAAGGGMRHAIVGSFYLIGLAALLSLPLGISLGVFLSEYSFVKLAKITQGFLEMLTGVPSIVVGILCYLLFKEFHAFAGAVSLSFIMIPILAKSTQEILRPIGIEVRQAGIALGLSKSQVIFYILLRGIKGPLITASIMSIARGAGETAPLLFTAFGSSFLSLDPTGPMASLPVQIYNYAISPFPEWHEQAWSAALFLVLFVLCLNIMGKRKAG